MGIKKESNKGKNHISGASKGVSTPSTTPAIRKPDRLGGTFGIQPNSSKRGKGY
jgi:hypothetical protein